MTAQRWSLRRKEFLRHPTAFHTRREARFPGAVRTGLPSRISGAHLAVFQRAGSFVVPAIRTRFGEPDRFVDAVIDTVLPFENAPNHAHLNVVFHGGLGSLVCRHIVRVATVPGLVGGEIDCRTPCRCTHAARRSHPECVDGRWEKTHVGGKDMVGPVVDGLHTGVCPPIVVLKGVVGDGAAVCIWNAPFHRDGCTRRADGQGINDWRIRQSRRLGGNAVGGRIGLCHGMGGLIVRPRPRSSVVGGADTKTVRRTAQEPRHVGRKGITRLHKRPVASPVSRASIVAHSRCGMGMGMNIGPRKLQFVLGHHGATIVGGGRPLHGDRRRRHVVQREVGGLGGHAGCGGVHVPVSRHSPRRLPHAVVGAGFHLVHVARDEGGDDARAQPPTVRAWRVGDATNLPLGGRLHARTILEGTGTIRGGLDCHVTLRITHGLPPVPMQSTTLVVNVDVSLWFTHHHDGQRINGVSIGIPRYDPCRDAVCRCAHGHEGEGLVGLGRWVRHVARDRRVVAGPRR
eukprot:m.36434 g.36434  ORF g.36434 m.36434 type:complete len:514 (+) comp5409_c0_seq1:322-1863(+)